MPLPPPSLPPPPPAPIAAHRASEANRADPALRPGSGAPRVELRSGSSGFGLLFLDVDNIYFAMMLITLTHVQLTHRGDGERYITNGFRAFDTK